MKHCKLIGRVVATEKNPTTMDKFNFWTDSNLKLHAFDIVKVEHIDGSFTYGVIESISHITDTPSFLSNFISSDFGNVEVDAPTLRVGMNYAEAAVSYNSKNLYTPVHNSARVYLASMEEVVVALGLLYPETAEKDKILEFDTVFRPIYMKHKHLVATERFIDFNQGVDARLATPEKMKKLSEINIRPLRIAFDHYEQKDIYIKAVKLAAKNGINNLSNYLLYNFMDTPEQLYYRMKINVDLCEKLNVNIYSFPMKYHPIADPEYFRNRNYIGKYWNRKFIRAIQAVLNATKGKIGRGQNFFKVAFGANVREFRDILWMPEAFIIYRNKYKANTEEWKKVFHGLPKKKLEMAKEIIAVNDFSNDVLSNIKDPDILNLLQYYTVGRRG